MLALIGVGVWAVINGGFGGGNILERIEKKDKVESGKKYAIYDEDFNDYVVEARWMNWKRKWQPTPVFLPGESQGRQGLMGCRLWGRTESDTTEAT